MRLASSVLTLVALLGRLATCTPLDLSNAERLQQGLPLKAPSRHYDPSRTNHLHARASLAPLPPAQQEPGSSFVEVGRGAPVTKRQTSASPGIGFLSYNPATGTVQVGTSGSALSFIPPVLSTRQGQTVYISSPDLRGRMLCARIVQVGTTGQSYINGLVLDGDTNSGLAGDISCNIWQTDVINNKLVASAVGSRFYIMSVDPATNNIVGTSPPWFGEHTGYIPATADRLSFGLGYQTVPQPSIAPGESYRAVLRVQKTMPGYTYVQFREQPNYSDFYFDHLEGATVFTVTRGITDPSRLSLSFTHAGTLRRMGLHANGPFYCGRQEPGCVPLAGLYATPSRQDAQFTADRPLLTEEVFSYSASIPSAWGFLGHFVVSGEVEGQAVTLRSDVGYSVLQTLQSRNVGPNRETSVYDVTIDIVPI